MVNIRRDPDRRNRILRWVVRYITANEAAPTIMEIGRAVGLRSTGSVHAYLKELEREGLIIRSRKHRGIQLTEKS